MTLGDHWEAEARNWIAWARAPGHDSYWRYHRDRFLELLPPPPTGLTLDVGCGEGRLPRDLKARGYDVIGVEVSPTLLEGARAADPDGDYRLSDAASLPLDDVSVALVTAFMSLHDMDDFDSAVAEAARVLTHGGRLCAAVVHPINSAGKFASREADAPFVISESYFDLRRITDAVESEGLHMTFSGNHRPFQGYVSAFAGAGLVIERIAEVGEETAPPGSRWRRVPLFLHLRGLKP